MRNIFKNFTDMNKSVLFSMALHLILALLLLFMQTGLDLPDTEFAEIGFVSSPQPSPPRSSRTPVQTPAQVDQGQIESTPSKTAPQPEEEPKAPPVNIPKRRMMEDENPQLSERTSGKLSPTADDAPIQHDNYESTASQKEVAEYPGGEKEFTRPGGVDSGKDVSAPVSNIGGTGSQTPFTIEGEAAKRQIVKQILPQYPPGLQREAVVKIRFTVLPDGRIGRMIPVQKGDPELEDLTMKVMRQWRFNRLSQEKEQQNVEGIITFRYKLQ